MRIEVGYPPVYDRICESIGTPSPTTVYTWGDIIYSPAGEDIITPDLRAHEERHRDQQIAVGGPEAWWERYLADPEWRAEQELDAYRAQYRFMKRHVRDRNALVWFRREIAGILSGPLYGRVMSGSRAYEAIGQ